MSTIERFWQQVLKTDFCWIWQGRTDYNTGVGRFYWNKKNYAATRFIYEWEIGPVSSRLQVIHRCTRKLCIRPSHLKVVGRGRHH